MHRARFTVLSTLGLLVVLFVAEAQEARAELDSNETDARTIMEAVDDRDTGKKQVATVEMVVEKGGRRRARTFRNSILEFKGGTKRLLQFMSPADIRNTGLLSVEYDDSDEDDDQWIYLPRLRKTKRIAGADKSDAWMGSDFSYSDLARHPPDEYKHKLIKKSARVGKEDCWVIESKPKTKRAKDETGYLKTHWWVSKDKGMVVQAKAWVKKGQRVKLFKFSKLEEVDGVWVAHQVAARTLSGKKVVSTTLLKFSKVKIRKAKVKKERFTVSGMEKGL